MCIPWFLPIWERFIALEEGHVDNLDSETSLQCHLMLIPVLSCLCRRRLIAYKINLSFNWHVVTLTPWHSQEKEPSLLGVKQHMGSWDWMTQKIFQRILTQNLINHSRQKWFPCNTKRSSQFHVVKPIPLRWQTQDIYTRLEQTAAANSVNSSVNMNVDEETVLKTSFCPKWMINHSWAVLILTEEQIIHQGKKMTRIRTIQTFICLEPPR